MTAVSPQPEPVSTLECTVCQNVSSPHGVAWAGSGYTAPEGRVAAGQAAYEAFVRAFPNEDWGPWERLIPQPMSDEDHPHAGWRAVAQAAIAAQDARPAPREFSDRITVFPDSGIVELNCFRCPGPRPLDTWQVGYHPSLDVLVEQARAHNAAKHGEPQDARPAPGYVTINARDIAIALNGYAGFTGDPVSFASELHERLSRTVFADQPPQPQPAPEPAAAMAETRQLRTALRTLADLWDAGSDKDEAAALRPNRAALVLEERATTRRQCSADIRKLAGPAPS